LIEAVDMLTDVDTIAASREETWSAMFLTGKIEYTEFIAAAMEP